MPLSITLEQSRRAVSKLGCGSVIAAPTAASRPNSRREMRAEFVPERFASLIGAPEFLPELLEDEFDTEV